MIKNKKLGKFIIAIYFLLIFPIILLFTIICIPLLVLTEMIDIYIKIYGKLK